MNTENLTEKFNTHTFYGSQLYLDLLEEIFKPLNDIQQEYNYLYEEGKIKGNNYVMKTRRITQVFDKIVQMNVEIQNSWELLEAKKREYDKLHSDTQKLVSYCELVGVNPNEIFLMKGATPNDFQEMVQEVRRKDKKIVLTPEKVLFLYYSKQIIDEIEKGRQRSLEILLTKEQTPRIKELINQLNNYE